MYFYALTAHFGHWREVGRRGPKALRWQVAADLIYGQVKKCYRRRKLVRVTAVMRLGTEAALKAALQGLGLSGKLNTCIGYLDHPFEREAPWAFTARLFFLVR